MKTRKGQGLGRKASEETKLKMSMTRLGKKINGSKHKEKRKNCSGENSNSWKGGVSLVPSYRYMMRKKLQ